MVSKNNNNNGISNNDNMPSLTSLVSENLPVTTPTTTTTAVKSNQQQTEEDLIPTIVNGTWELVSVIYDIPPYLKKDYEIGDLRILFNIKEERFQETVPAFWGLSSSSIQSRLIWNQVRWEITLDGNELTRSSIPWQIKLESQQTMQVKCL
jgi:hypothetical protein